MTIIAIHYSAAANHKGKLDSTTLIPPEATSMQHLYTK